MSLYWGAIPIDIDTVKQTVKTFEKYTKGYLRHKTIFCHKLGLDL